MELTQEMRWDIELLTSVVADDAAIAKALRRKHNVNVSVVAVRKYRKAIATELPPTPVDVPEPKEDEVDADEAPSIERDQAPVARTSSLEMGSTLLMASICRLAFKCGKLLPNMTLDEQRERARADGYRDAIPGWA